MPDSFPQIKVVILGDHLTGRTTIMESCTCRRRRERDMDGFPYYELTDFTYESTEFVAWVWDYGGAARPYDLRRSFFLGAYAGLVVFDINNQESFDHIHDWVKRFWASNGVGPVPMIIVANKGDLRTHASISPELMDRVARTLSDQTKENGGFQVRAIESSMTDRASLLAATQQLWLDAVRFGGWWYAQRHPEE